MGNGNSGANWQFVTAMVSLALATVGASVWMGQLANQTGVNTARLDRLEVFANEIRDHDANTNATFKDVDRRLNHLESRFTPQPH